ncbi:MAG: HD domain-containing protein [Eubacterium sp.]|nr:HD domain-containing protein [Eubacterium sp.]
MRIVLPEKVNSIIDCLQNHGFEAYAVGGCVRDSILGREPQDWDITTSAKPEEVKALFSYTIDTGIQHGTVTVMLDHEGFEVTTYRIDGEYEDARHPKEVTFTSQLIEDLKRRDFTINAMAYNDRDGLVDAFDGIGDLERKIIRCVGNPMERFTEDALRILRAVRFAAQLDCSIDGPTKAAITRLAPNLSKISAERIQVELVKLLISPNPDMMRDVYALGIADVVLPEFSLLMTTEQNNEYHIYTTGEHTLHSLPLVPADKVLRLTMLLHDIEKPSCKTTDENGVDHFYGHQSKGAETARKILRRLKFDNDTIQKVCALIKIHDDKPELTLKSVRKAMFRHGLEQYPNLFAVKRADAGAQSQFNYERKMAYIDEYERLYQQILEEQNCLSLKDLAITGKDLIALGIAPGKAIGEILNKMLQDVLEQPELNDREILIKRLQENEYF